MTNSHLKRVLAMVLALTMVLSLSSVSAYAVGQQRVPVSYQEMDANQVSAQLQKLDSAVEENTAPYADDEMVRVTIVLEGDSALSAMGLEAAPTSAYRQDLKARQERMADKISAQVLGGQELDVVWNLTLTTNAISANVAYGKVEAIRELDGVKAVYLEKRYEPLAAETANTNSQVMTGAAGVKADGGYSGAGTRIAVIDTGTDTDHQSFDAEGWLYALELEAKALDMSLEDYMASLDLLTLEEVAQVLPSLNAFQRTPEITAEDLYYNGKLAFNYNYVDRGLDVTHDNDQQGSHGSHVAGIATANSHVKADPTTFDFDGDGDLDQDDAQALLAHVTTGTPISALADISGNGSVTAYDAHLLLEMIESGTVYANADLVCAMTGTAPNAQLITMKVFGATGGAYTNDYMAGVEDAVALGCDVVNLSLGSSPAGYSTTHEDDDSLNQYVNGIMAELDESGIVMAVAAGNSGNWADQDYAFGLMYTDEAGTALTSDPATYTNSFSVASVDNTATVGYYFNAAGVPVVYTENQDAGSPNGPMAALDTSGDLTGTDYEFVLMDGIGAAADYEGIDLEGKIAFCARGEISFGEKGNYAMDAGAAALVVYNNVAGTFGMLLDGYTYTNPCVSIQMHEAQQIRENAQIHTTADGRTYYTGTITVYGQIGTIYDESGYYTMSDFSSWGSTGGLAIKPEITAPGGAINSVNGVDPSGTAYEIMSGTSMAAPHLSGLAALASQYLREEDVLTRAQAVSGLETLTQRHLIQSLLMSTAEPVIEAASGVEYSVRNQGSGLANIENLINAPSFILVDGQPDGKVKIELGDSSRDWTATFSINNLTHGALVYDLSASILTTGTTVGEAFGKTHTLSTDELVKLGAIVTFTGETVEDGKVTVPASGSAQVTVSIEIPESLVMDMITKGYTNGFYVEGFVYAAPAAGVTHSIPLLGWYGNWTDPSMFDTGSYLEYAYGLLERPSHIDSPAKNALTWQPVGDTTGYYYSGNVYGLYDGQTLQGDQRYIPDRNALNSTADATWRLYAVFPTLIRNAADAEIRVTDADTGKLYWSNDFEHMDDYMLGSFYYPNDQQWQDTTANYGVGIEWDGTDPDTGLPVPEGTNIEVTMYAAPEYYLDGSNNVDYSQVGQGAKLSWQLAVDNTAPGLVGGADALTMSPDGKTLYFTAQDNRYIAAVILLNGSANAAVEYFYPDMSENQKGQAISGSFNVAEYTARYGNKAVIVVADYAGNETYYALNLLGEGTPYGDLVGFQYGIGASMMASGVDAWVSFSEGVSQNETRMFVGGTEIVAAEYVNGYVFALDVNAKLYAIPYESMLANTIDLESTYIARLERTYQDLTYNYAEGKLYGLYTYIDAGYPNSELYTINLKGEYYDSDLWMTVAPYQEDWASGRGGVYGLTVASDETGAMYMLGTNYDRDTETIGTTAHLWKATMEESWGMVYMGPFQDLGDTGLTMDYLQSMTWNHNNGKLYWARFAATASFETVSELVEVNPSTAQCTVVGTLSTETCALMAPLTAETAAREAYSNVPAFDRTEIATPVLNQSVMTMNVGSTTTLTYDLDPWYSGYKDVVWSSSDETVATVEDGVVTAVKEGLATITVASAEDSSKYTTCQVTVAALDLKIEGIISAQSAGLGNVTGISTYQFNMVDGISSFATDKRISWPEEFQGFGTSLASSTMGRGSIWACEYGNTGMIYEIDPETGVVKDMLSPIDADMMFGLAYSEELDVFAGIMNMYLFVDLPMTHEAEEEMMDSYDEELHQFTWHRLNLLDHLLASDKNYNTGETGQGASSEVVFSGVTYVDGGTYHELYTDYLGKSSGQAMYTPVTTLVLLDNVGRLWYIDEITDMALTSDEWGNTYYTDSTGTMMISPEFGGVEVLAYEDGTYSVFVIREIAETPLTDMYLTGNLPRITYHFSDLYHYQDANGTDMFVMSLYDYWNNGTTNELYLYVPGVGTGEFTWDESWNRVEIKTPDALYDLGDTGEHNIIATINRAEITGGLAPQTADVAAPLAVGVYTGRSLPNQTNA